MAGPPPTRGGFDAYEVVSALQKAIRRSNPEQAVFWAVELYESGYANWLWKRLRTICSEDIGPADRYLPAQIATLNEWSDRERPKGGGGMEMVHAVLLLASARKSRVACWSVIAMAAPGEPRFQIPDEALDQHTRRGRSMGRGLPHFMAEAQKLIDPDEAARSRGHASMADELADLETRCTCPPADVASASGPLAGPQRHELQTEVHRGRSPHEGPPKESRPEGQLLLSNEGEEE